MTDKPSETGSNGDPNRDASGRFRPGNRAAKGNPNAKRMARLKAAFHKRFTPGDMEEIVARVIRDAKQGDNVAVKLLWQWGLGPPVAADVLEREETREMVNATMSQLPPHYREALEAKYIQRQTVRQIAAHRATSDKAVESLLTRARQAFRETFLALAQSLNTEMFPS